MTFTLEPYRGPASRFDCPACNVRKKFSRYINTDTDEYLADHVGRCDREVNCGYHYKPGQYFDAEGGWRRAQGVTGHLKKKTPPAARQAQTQPPTATRQPTFIHSDYVNASFTNYEQNNFVQYLIKRFGFDTADALVGRYRIGISAHWPGATVFWQLDAQGLVRTGKIMLYDAETCKRVKEPFSHITWVHSVLSSSSTGSSSLSSKENTAIATATFQLRQCLFGEHLLKEHPDKPVAIVESEKTAIITSVYLPQMIWLATGSLSNLNADKCQVLKGRNVTLFPDLGAYDKWQQKAKEISKEFKVSDFLEANAFEDERKEGLDMADHLLRFDVSEMH